MTTIRRLAVVPAVLAALAAPAVASASAPHGHHCGPGYHKKVTHVHHKSRVVCVRNPRHAKHSAAHKPSPGTSAKPPSTTTSTPSTSTTTAPVAASTAPTQTSTPPVQAGAPTGPPSGVPPTGPPVSGPPSPAAQLQPSAVGGIGRVSVRSAGNADSGTAYAADVSCNGALSAWDVITATGTSYQPGYIDLSPAATPGSAFSSQWVAARSWVYSYSQGRWQLLTNWQEKVVTAPNPNLVSVGDTSGSPFRASGNVGAFGWVYVDTQYYWWTGSQWVGGTFAPTTSYLQAFSATSRTTGNTWCYLG